jgi:predicted TIM-barrel fold metal-dependent hydrolase
MNASYRVIDADGHVTESDEQLNEWAARMPAEYRALAPRIFRDEYGSRYFIVEGKLFPGHRDRSFQAYTQPKKAPQFWTTRPGELEPHARMPDMDFMGIDLSVVFCSSFVGVPAIVEDADLAAAIARAYNDWLAEYCGAYPDRLKGVALLPVQDAELAVQELRRAVTELGLVGGLFPPQHRDLPLDNAHFFPIYEEAERLGVPICIHFVAGIYAGRELFDNFILRHAYGTLPQMMALGSLLVGGVLERYPRLRVGILEAGVGWIPYILERIQWRYSLMPGLAPHLTRSPEEQVKGDQLFFSLEPDEPTVPMVARLIGEHQLVTGSDYAHWDGTSPESIRIVRERADLSDDLKRKILSDNPARFYGI